MYIPGSGISNLKQRQQALPVQRSISALDFADDEADDDMLGYSAYRAKSKQSLPVGTKVVVPPRLLEWDEQRPRQQRIIGGGKKLVWLEPPTGTSPEQRRPAPTPSPPKSTGNPLDSTRNPPHSVSKALDRALGTLMSDVGAKGRCG